MSSIVSFGNKERFGHPRDVLIFDHIPKTAGQTFCGILKHSLGMTQDCNTVAIWPEILDVVHQTEQPQGILGHATWGIHEHLDKKHRAFYITFLRHPLTLLQSLYSFMCKNYMITCSLDEYILEGHHASNTLCRMLGGRDPERARKRLEKEIYLFGFTDNFDQSLALFAEYLPLDISNYRSFNVNLSNKKQVMSEEARAVALERNRLDIELYDWAYELFQTRFGKQLALLPKVNKLESQINEGKADVVGFHQNVADLVENGPFEEAYRALEDPDIGQWPFTFAQSMLCHRYGRWEWLRKACLNGNVHWPETYNLELIHACIETDLEEAVALFHREMVRMLPLRTQIASSHSNKYLRGLFGKLILMMKRFMIQDEPSSELVAQLRLTLDFCATSFLESSVAETLDMFMQAVETGGCDHLIAKWDDLIAYDAAQTSCREACAVAQYVCTLPSEAIVCFYGCTPIAWDLVRLLDKTAPQRFIFVTSFQEISTQYRGYPKMCIDDLENQKIDRVLILSYIYENEMLAKARTMNCEAALTLPEILAETGVGDMPA